MKARRRILALVVALAVLGGLSVAAFSSPARRAKAPVTVATEAIPPPPHPAGTAVARREQNAIDRVRRYAPVITAGSARRREVALTFDDGPSPYTAMILRVLARKHVPATFFIVGSQLTRFSRELRAELHRRETIGDHTESHAWLPHLSPAQQAHEIIDAGLRVRHDGGAFPRLFRPPYGVFNPTTLRVLRRARMLMVLWSVDPGDWRRPGAKAIVATVLAKTRPGAIVILHDGGGYRNQTVAALPSIIDGLRRRHYRLVSVPRLLMDDPPPRHQHLPRFAQGGA